jgi:predicted glutamine amidotransferase
MCIIICKPKGLKLSDEALENSWSNNDDGAGFMWADKGRIRTIKVLKSYARFKKAYDRFRTSEDLDHKAVVLHFRIGTSGHKSIDNCHPFMVNDNVALCHNGILSCVDVPANSKVNDTRIFINKFFKKWDKSGTKDWLADVEWLSTIEKLIGAYNKFVLMNNRGEVVILNESQGTWDSKCWFSNSDYKYKRYSFMTGAGSYCDYENDYWDKAKSTRRYYGDDWEWSETENKMVWIGQEKARAADNKAVTVQTANNLVPFSEQKPTETNPWPEETEKAPPLDEIDMPHDDPQYCLECHTKLSDYAIQLGFGCCEGCVNEYFDEDKEVTTLEAQGKMPS